MGLIDKIPDWLMPLLSLIGLAAFIYFAFKGLKEIKPDEENIRKHEGDAGPLSPL